MYRPCTVLVLGILVFSVTSLHLLDNTQAQIDALKSQQNQFENLFGKLLSNITQI